MQPPRGKVEVFRLANASCVVPQRRNLDNPVKTYNVVVMGGEPAAVSER